MKIYNCKKSNKILKINVYKYSIYILYIVAYLLYFLSLESCLDGEELCGNNMKWIYTKVSELIISCELISFLIASIIFNHSSKFNFIHILSVYAFFFNYSHDFYFTNHGMYNIIVFSLLLFLNIIIIMFLKLLIHLFTFNNKLIIFKSIFITLLFIIYNFQIPDIVCDDWEKGLNNTSIDDNKEIYGCKIERPKYCEYKIFSPYQDFTKMLGINCSFKQSNYRKIILEKSNSPYITKNTTKFGFPPTNNGLIATIDGLDNKILKEFVSDNIFDIDNNWNNFSEPEIIVDFSTDPLGELKINLK